MDLKGEYQGLAKKYGLPSYEELDNDFELLYIPSVTEMRFPLRFVRRRMNDKIGWYCNMIQSLLQPNPQSFINLQESRHFSDEERKEMLNLLKEMMILERLAMVVDLQLDEKMDAEWIKESYKKWRSYQDKLQKIAKRLEEVWKKEETKRKDMYFG